ncbi:ABC transporter ATP-binding protein [Alteribacillus sp. HJP-4]|uniref:ABC transporter ATP-binding protein n=1 Tax=Alteribacillus sp. HJP-4 TaxID=2775394 RepID=UPI0035CCCE31
MSFLEVKDMTISFGDNVILENITFSAERGEILSLAGRSGTGKSTLLRSIAGFTPISAGSLRIDGKSMQVVKAEKRPVVMIFQRPLLFPHLTVLQNVTYGLRVRRIPKKQRELEGKAILEKVDLLSYADKYPGQCSGGQQQRVALARALILRPQLLLLDEPFVSLDEELRRSMQEWVRELLKNEGTTAIFVTHDKNEAMVMGDSLAILGEKKIIQKGLLSELYQKPVHHLTASFLGDGIFLKNHSYMPASAFRLQMLRSTEDMSLKEHEYKAVIRRQTSAHGLTFFHYYLPSVDQMLILPGEGNLRTGDEVLLSADTKQMIVFDTSNTREERSL